MKIILVTVYNSHNSGSFLQAYSLMRILQTSGHEVAFLKRNVAGSSHDLKRNVKAVVKSLIRLRFSRAVSFLRQWRIYDALQKRLPVVSKDSKYYADAECVVIGSDTLWNFKSNYFRSNAATYLGTEFKGKRVVAYAISAANTPPELFKRVVASNGNLNSLDRILVRDNHTRRLVKELLGTDCPLVADPTLLISPAKLDVFRVETNTERPYLLLYIFKHISAELREALCEYARRNDFDIVSMPGKRSWCNMSLMSSPQNMVSYFRDAAAVVTDTFHGTALSILFDKRFAVFDEGKMKVTDLLESVGLTDLLFSDSSQVSEILERGGGSRRAELIASVRDNSVSLLIDALTN